MLTPEAAAALARIARVSGVKAEPKTLLPAEVILELSGEAVRSLNAVLPALLAEPVDVTRLTPLPVGSTARGAL